MINAKDKVSACLHYKEWRVCKGNAGFYVEIWCSECGQLDRVSDYYETAEEAQDTIDAGAYDFYGE